MGVLLRSYMGVLKRQLYGLVKRFCVSLEAYMGVSKRPYMPVSTHSYGDVLTHLHKCVLQRRPLIVAERRLYGDGIPAVSLSVYITGATLTRARDSNVMAVITLTEWRSNWVTLINRAIKNTELISSAIWIT